MIDLSLLREQPELVAQRIANKDPQFPADQLLERDKTVRALQHTVELLRSEKNALSKEGPVTEEIRAQSIELGKKLKASEGELAGAQVALNELWLSCPNLPEDMVPVGNKESNKVVKTWGNNPAFTFKPKHHLELNEQADWFDLEVGTKISGAQFVFYKEKGAKVLYALTHMMIKNNAKHGFKPVIPPYLVTEKALYNSGNLPKFKGDFYEMNDDGLCLIPTAEVSLANVHANEIIPAKDLPIRYTAWTSCFRKEAGGYGSNERGIIRIHQFEKVELFSLTKPENSNDELNRMVACAEDLLQQLGLSYQVSLLAGQDCSFCSAKTFDIEVWLPGQEKHYEVSSASNCTDFQARRGKIRYREEGMKKPQLVHTQNASSLALPRLMIALMEQGQQEDGTIVLPEALQKVMDILW